MPIIYAFAGDVYRLFEHPWSKHLALILILYIGIALVSERIQKLINIKALSDDVWQRFSRFKRSEQYYD